MHPQTHLAPPRQKILCFSNKLEETAEDMFLHIMEREIYAFPHRTVSKGYCFIVGAIPYQEDEAISQHVGPKLGFFHTIPFEKVSKCCTRPKIFHISHSYCWPSLGVRILLVQPI